MSEGKIYTNGKKAQNYFAALLAAVMYCSSAIVMEGAFGLGA